MSHQYNGGIPSVALITVGLDPELAEEIANAISRLPTTVMGDVVSSGVVSSGAGSLPS